MVKAALIGLGFWGERIAEALQSSKSINLVRVFSRNEAKRQEFATKYGCRAAISYEEILEDPTVDAIILVTPNSIHAEQIELAAQKGKHVLVEKPLADTMANARRIATAVNKAGIILSVGHNRRRLPEIRLIKQWLAEGKIGSPVTVEANFSSDNGFKIKPGEWRWSKEECGSGPLIQLAVHHADTLQYLLGAVQTVTGVQKRLHTAAEIMDTTTTLLEFSSGCLGCISSSYITPRICRIILTGTSGQIFYDEDIGLLINKGGGYEQIELEPKQQYDRVLGTLREEIDEFANCIVFRKKPEVSLHEGLMALAVVQAAERSQIENRPIYLKELINP